MNIDHTKLPSIANASLPVKYEAARVALLECDRVDECKDWADKSAALASYAKQSKDEELFRTSMRIKARAIRRCGELLREIEAKAHRGKKGGTVPDHLSKRKQAADEAGLSGRQAKDAIRVANVPEESFEEQVESDDPPTITALAEQGKRSLTPKEVFEASGMTKAQFQAGMYFGGDIAAFAKKCCQYESRLQDVAAGTVKQERNEMKARLEKIETTVKKLRKLL
jgi:hypothetical protein